jgi:hypothetical protein
MISTVPVMKQIIMVSKKIPVMEISPCLAGSFTFAAAAAIGTLPRPDSFEKIPRAIPILTASITPAPRKPPLAAVHAKAEFITREQVGGIEMEIETA